MQSCKLMVSGDVHGVGYRAFCKHKAIELGLSGYAKNLPEGSVEVLVAGSDLQIAEFINYLKSNSPGFSRVDEIELVAKAAAGRIDGSFKIL